MKKRKSKQASKQNPNILSVAIWLHKKEELRQVVGKEFLQCHDPHQSPCKALNQKGKKAGTSRKHRKWGRVLPAAHITFLILRGPLSHATELGPAESHQPYTPPPSTNLCLPIHFLSEKGWAPRQLPLYPAPTSTHHSQRCWDREWIPVPRYWATGVPSPRKGGLVWRKRK